MRLEKKIERLLWDMICRGYGDGETVKIEAKKLTDLARRHYMSADKVFILKYRSRADQP